MITGRGFADSNIKYSSARLFFLIRKVMSKLYDVEVPTINYHINKIFKDSELQRDSVIRKFLITAEDGKTYSTNH